MTGNITPLRNIPRGNGKEPNDKVSTSYDNNKYTGNVATIKEENGRATNNIQTITGTRTYSNSKLSTKLSTK